MRQLIGRLVYRPPWPTDGQYMFEFPLFDLVIHPFYVWEGHKFMKSMMKCASKEEADEMFKKLISEKLESGEASGAIVDEKRY